MHGLTAGTNTDPQVYISHEVVELLTNVSANSNLSPGWTTTSFCPGASPCEIADKCGVTIGVGNYTSTVGTNTWGTSYYSNKGGGCILPGILASTNPATNVFTNPGLTGILPDAHIILLFWKTGWSFTNSTSPTLGSADEIKAGVQNLISKTKYFTGLAEYGITQLTYDWAAINSTTALPATFRETDVQQAIKDSMNAGAIPIPAENNQSMIYIVIVDSSAQFVTVGQQGGHGSFSYGSPPPNNVPTTNPPVGSTPGIQADPFGITQLYPSKAGGSSWSLPSNPSVDTRHVVDSTTFTTNADGSYKVSSASVVYNIAANNGFTEASLVLNQATLNSQKHMQDTLDWTNIEQTCYYRVNAVASSTHNGPPNIIHAMRGARETNDATILNGFPKSCEAADYRMTIEPISGIISFQKDLQHTAGMTSSSQNPKTSGSSVIPGGLSAWQAVGGGWRGLKSVCYTRSDGVSVQLEFWVDLNNENKWTKFLSFVDQGNWGGGKPACGGTSNMVINWGGPLTKFEWFNITDMDIKWASIREIDLYGQNPTTPSPPSNTPPTTDPTGNPPANLPPSPPPPNVNPPLPAYNGIKDKFGVTMLYPTLASGENWYLSSNGLTGDPRVFITPLHDKETVNGDGSFHLQNNDDVMIDVATSQGYSFQLAGGLKPNHKVCDARQYLMAPRDWKNVEITFFHNIDSCKTKGNTGRFDCDIRARHGSHSKTGDCQAAAYIAHIRCDTNQECKFSKRQWMEHRPDDDERRPRGVAGGYPYTQVLKRWVGRKLVVYNIVDPETGKVTGVKLEHYWNDSGNGVTWKKLHDTTDWGGWGDADDLCGGFKDQIITWGGPFISFTWDDLINLSYKWLSVREIDVNVIGGPPSPSPGGGPPPGPPLVNPVIGPNIYNVLKVVSSVIIDDSGGCNIGVNPNQHIGETQLGVIPGTASQINMAGIVTAAQRAGQKVVNTSSVLYNKILAEAVFNLRIVGFPTTGTPAVPAPITCTIRRGVDDTIVNTYGQLPANVLSSVYQPISFKSPAIPNYTLAVGDIVTLEFTGGDASNYLQVQTDTTSGFDGANGYAMDVINNVVSNLTTTDMAGGFWGTGQTGVQATRFYNLGKGGAQVGAFYISNGAATKVAEIPVNSSSTLIGRTVNEIDVFLAKRGNPTGQVLVYILENTTGLVTYGFGSLDASKIPDIGSGYQQFNFFNYNNVFVNDVNSYMVVEFSGGDLNNQVAVACDASNPIDASNTNAYMFSGSWNPTSANGVTYATDMCGSMWGAGNPPAVLPPGSGSTGTPYSVKGNAIEGFTSKFNATGNAWYMVGELLNDAQSILVGIQINEIDLSLARVGTPVGQIQIFIFQANGNTIGTSSVNVDVSTLPTTPTPSNVKFPIVWSTSTSTYTLQVGDRICVQWTGGNPSTELLGNYVIISTNSSDSFDGNHSVLVTFTATGVYPSGGQYGVWNGIGGQWAVVTGWDLAGTFYT